MLKLQLNSQRIYTTTQDTFSSALTRWLILVATSCRAEFNSCCSPSFLPTNWWIWVLRFGVNSDWELSFLTSIVCDIWNKHICRIKEISETILVLNLANKTLTWARFSRLRLLMAMLDVPSLALTAWRTSFSATSRSCFTFDSSVTINLVNLAKTKRIAEDCTVQFKTNIYLPVI